jgi:murein DD-endopeptidase MepM/ murein hydrolase activator NlpD
VRNSFTLTITDFRGARHFSIRQIAKAYALGLVLSLLVTFLIGALTILWLSGRVSGLNGELEQLQARRASIYEDHARLLEDMDRLQQAVTEKEQELAQVSDELGTLEVMIGLEPSPEQDIKARLDTASQTALEKTLMLQAIPSGYPLEYRGITSKFGYRIHPVKNTKAFHSGLDFRAPMGTPVYATAEGVVEWAGYHKSSGLGHLVILHHNFGFNTFYGHLQRTVVKAGDFVKKGDLVAYTGNSGLSSGPHLHYEVRHIQRRLDPVPFVEWSLNQYDTLFTKEGRVQWDALASVIRERVNLPGRRLSQREPVSEEN